MPRRRLPPLRVKVRLIPRVRMRKQDALKLARRMLHTRIVPQGMELAYVDWKSGEGRHYRSGDYVGQEAHDALVGFMAAMTHPGTRVRVEVVRGGSYEG